MEELAGTEPAHFLADRETGAARRQEAVEDLARWWLFVLLARHQQQEFDLPFPDSFFHGVHGPDFVLDEDGRAYFGGPGEASHLGLFDPKAKVETSGKEGTNVAQARRYAGPRRMHLNPDHG